MNGVLIAFTFGLFVPEDVDSLVNSNVDIYLYAFQGIVAVITIIALMKYFKFDSPLYLTQA